MTSWSLACDMQCFIIATAALFIYIKYVWKFEIHDLTDFFCRSPKTGKNLLLTLGFVVNIVGAVIVVHHTFLPRMDVVVELFTTVYTNPFPRAIPYLFGTITAVYLNESGGQFAIATVI